MTIEQQIVRWVMVLPMLILILAFLPISGGGYQFIGIFDADFLGAGVVDGFMLFSEIAAVFIVWLIIEQYAKNAMDYF